MIPTPKRSIITNKSLKHARHVQAQWKITGAMIKLLPNRGWNQKQKHKKQPWCEVECFAFGGATVRFASLETVSMPPTTQSLRHPLTRAFHVAPRIKTARRFTAKKPLKIVICFYEAMSKRQTKGTVLLVC